MRFKKGAVIGSIQMADNEKVIIPNEETEKFHCDIRITKEKYESIQKYKKENTMKEVVNLLIDKLENAKEMERKDQEFILELESDLGFLRTGNENNEMIIDNLRDEVQQYKTVLKAVQEENNNKQDLEEKDARIKELKKINNNLYFKNYDMGVSLRNIQDILKTLNKPYDKLESISNCWFPDQKKEKEDPELTAFKKQ